MRPSSSVVHVTLQLLRYYTSIDSEEYTASLPRLAPSARPLSIEVKYRRSMGSAKK